ncbi:MAG: SpaA isopeptide-forming pilin-related protein [Chloroflexota bacterium]
MGARPATSPMRSSALALAMLASFALLASLVIGAQAVRATDTGTIAIFKDMCNNFGQQDTCNGRDSSLDGWHIDYTVQPSNGQGGWDASIQTITVTLGENAGGGGNTGGGSQGRAEGTPVAPETYLVCEVPEAYNDAAPPDTVPLDALPRPESGNGGSSGGPQLQVGDNCIQVTTTTGTSELKFLDQQLPVEGTGSLVILKTDDGDPALGLPGAEFTLADSQGTPVNGTFTTGADGTFCVQGLEVDGTYTVTETKAPAGYAKPDPASQEVVVTQQGACADRGGAEDTEDASFIDTLISAPLVPNLVIDKAASVDQITISGAVGSETASPSSVTWTLTYTLTNGPVDNAVITDVVPTGFTFVSASNGGTLGGDGKTVTWDLGTLSASGSVTLVTSVDVATISRSAPTVNTATIDSDQTEPDNGQDSVTVRVNAPPLAGNPTPTPAGQVPNTAMGPIGSAPTVLLALVLLGSLGGLAWTNRARTSRRRR